MKKVTGKLFRFKSNFGKYNLQTWEDVRVIFKAKLFIIKLIKERRVLV